MALLWVVPFVWASNRSRFFHLLRVVVEICVEYAFLEWVNLLH
jgi:hypothetical protein